MVKFNLLLASASATDFKFVRQNRVSLVTFFSGRLVSYSLTKDDVITSIRYYLSCICALIDKPVMSAGLNFSSPEFKMHDLVPYLYSLINLYIHVRHCKSYEYVRSLPELKLTCFCRLPFEDEIVVNEKHLCNVKYAVLPALGDDNDTKCVCRLPSGCVLVEDTSDALELHLSNLFPMYRIHLYCDQPF